MKKFILLLVLFLPFYCFSQSESTEEYLKVIKQEGQEPVAFVNNILDSHDLVIFDDGLHSAWEPYVFYRQLINNAEFQNKVGYIFLEVIGISSQVYIDKFLENPIKDSTILCKVFQDDFTGYGWKYQTSLDVLNTVWEINQKLPESSKIKVIGVDQPIYWEALHTREDYDIFQESLVARDYFMYLNILNYLDKFNSGRKGIFITNTRHAYKKISRSDGTPYWNCGTFFNQWHKGKTYSIRMHNVNLEILKTIDVNGNKSTEGLDQVEYRWVKMEDGKWDQAFEANGNKPVAIPFKENVFGNAKYLGNHMLNAMSAQTMYDAYDALIFLAPIDKLHFSPQMDFLYTASFKKELKRRILLINNNEIESFLEKQGMNSIEEYIIKITEPRGLSKNTLLN